MIKIINPKEVELKFKNMTDRLGMGIDKNIFRSVVILNSLGYKTRQSCEGHLNNYPSYPWIDLIWNEEEGTEYYNQSLNFFYKYLFQDLNEYYNLKPKNYDQIIRCFKFNEPELIIRLSQFQNSKCFENKREEKLEEYLNEINDFCEFLNQKYKLNY
jgi:hypothetical protein